MYKFNLQVLLDYRKRIEEGLQIELSQVRQKWENAKQLVHTYQGEKSYYEDELIRREEEAINVNESRLYRDYLKGMTIKIREQREVAVKVKEDYDKKQEELLEATKKRKVLEKVREKYRKRFKASLEKKERILINEIGIRNYQRNI